MKTDLYIPKTITVGYVERSNTFTGKLAYVIYTDHKGVLRKQTSWENWRDKNIEPQTFDNVPQPNFTFNKGIERDGHWGSGRSKIRVWDPRSFEIEIEVDNLIGILMHSDVSKRDIIESCVYAWNGADLILLPTNSVEYQESVSHTEKQGMKVGAKELGIGYTYEIKKDRAHVVYLGRFPTYDVDTEYVGRRHAKLFTRPLEKKPQHVFYDLTTRRHEFKSPTQYLAQVVSEECHPQYADFLDKFYHQHSSQPMVGIISAPPPNVIRRDFTVPEYYVTNYPSNQMAYYTHRTVIAPMMESRWVRFADNQCLRVKITAELFTNHYGDAPKHLPVKATVQYEGAAVYDPDTQTVKYSVPKTGDQRGYYGEPYYAGTILPELNANTPGVKERIEEIRADLQAALVGVTQMNQYEAPISSVVLGIYNGLIDWGIKHSVGNLYILLQDGKISEQTI